MTFVALSEESLFRIEHGFSVVDSRPQKYIHLYMYCQSAWPTSFH